MRVNQSDGSQSNNEFLQQWSNSSQVISSQPSHFTFGAKGKQNLNPYRRTQVIIAIALAVLTTLWVQITMQRHAPFIRTAQCFFNQVIFFHDSQDIYEGDDVIYWRNGQTYSFDEIKGIFIRLTDTLQNLDEVSMFQIPQNHTRADSQDAEVDILVIYRFDIPRRYERADTYNCSIDGMDEMFNSTLLNRTFYEHLWKIEMSITKAVVYRGQIYDMQLFFSGQIYSSMLMQYKMDVTLVDELSKDIKNDGQFNKDKLGVRKLQNPHNLELESTYLQWIILLLFMVVAVLQYRFLVQKNVYINEKIKQKLLEENRIQQLLEKIGDRVEKKGSVVDSFILNMIEEKEELGNNKNKRITLPLGKRIKKIGFYYVLELVVSIMAFVGFYNSHNGLICFFAWLKILIYLAQTKNRLMFGFLFEQALPIYLRVQVNILLLMTSFVLFNMLVCTASNKFQTVQLGYFQYLFNYFQYGIYENFKKAFEPYGMITQFFYFCQMMLLLYVGNNILISILASQVSKNSMLLSVEEMLDEMQMKCPQCGTNFARKKGKAGQQEQYQKEKLVSKLMKDLQFEKSRLQSEVSSPDHHDEEQINIVIQSPLLSPYFPRKNQKKKDEEQFMSPNLKNKKLQERLRAIDKKMQQEQDKTTSKLQAYQQLKIKVNPAKKTPQVELAQSEIHAQSNQKYLKKVKTKCELLFKAIEELRPEKSKKDSIPAILKNKVYSEVLQKLLGKVNEFQKDIKKSING